MQTISDHDVTKSVTELLPLTKGKRDQVQFACQIISACWNETQRKARRIEANRLQSQLYLMLLRNAQRSDQLR